MTTGVGDVGNSLLCHARYLHSLIAQSVEAVMLATLAVCLHVSEVMRKVCLVAEAMGMMVVHTPVDVNIQCAGALVPWFIVLCMLWKPFHEPACFLCNDIHLTDTCSVVQVWRVWCVWHSAMTYLSLPWYVVLDKSSHALQVVLYFPPSSNDVPCHATHQRHECMTFTSMWHSCLSPLTHSMMYPCHEQVCSLYSHPTIFARCKSLIAQSCCKLWTWPTAWSIVCARSDRYNNVQPRHRRRQGFYWFLCVSRVFLIGPRGVSHAVLAIVESIRDNTDGLWMTALTEFWTSLACTMRKCVKDASGCIPASTTPNDYLTTSFETNWISRIMPRCVPSVIG